MPESSIRFHQALLLPVTIKRSLKTALIVGTLLILINHIGNILICQWPAIWVVLLTYLVPYSVSSYATAVNICDVPK